MTAAEPTPAPPPGPLPGSRAGDAALAALALLLGAQEVLAVLALGVPGARGLLDGPAAVVAGSLLALAQAATVLVRRYRPRRAYAALAATATALFLLVGGFAVLVWGFLAFSVTRAPGRAAGWLLGPLLGAVAVITAVRAGGGPDLATQLGAAVGTVLNAVPLVLVGAAAGRWTRTAARRAEHDRRETDRLRRATALEAERARIAEEVGTGVLAGLQRLVEQARRFEAGPAGAVTEAELRRLREQARTVLAAMRRVLGVLRAPAGPPPGTGGAGPAEADAAGPGRARRALPVPDRAGLVTLGAFLVVAVALAALTAPAGPADDAVATRLVEMLALPFGDPLALLVVAGQFVAIAWWRTAPVPALLVSGAGSLLAGLLGGTNLFAETGWSLLVWGAATRVPARRSAAAVALSTLVVLLGGLLSGSFEQLGGVLQVSLSFLAVVPLWAAGALVRRHRRDTERRHAERTDADARHAVAQERLRVARELHDVVAHHVSAIAVQAGAARMAADDTARAAALADIAESGRRVAAALPELAGLTPDPHGVVLDPDGVDRLLVAAREAGLPVRADVVGTPAGPPGEAELFAQRILTEALTNVLRHAGLTPTRVRVEHDTAAISVEVADDGPAPGHAPSDAGSGLGLVGMRERVSLLGGELRAGTAGAGDGAGWTVHAVLPRTALLPADEAAAGTISSSAPTRTDPPGP